MPQQNVARLAFNRGLVSPLALTRTDIERVELSAEQQTNFVPRVLGSMMLRPGTKYLDSTKSDAQAFHIPFVKSTDDTALIEMTSGAMRVRTPESVITKPSVSTAVVNSSFTSTDLNGNSGSTDGFVKLSDPADLPSSTVQDVAFSDDGRMFVVGTDIGPTFTTYTISGTTFTQGQDLNPGGAVQGVAFNPSTSILSVAANNSPYIFNYPITGTTVGSVLSTPATAPTGVGRAVAWSRDGNFLAVAHDTSPFITVYQYTAPSTFTKIANPATLPTGNANGVAWSEDGTLLAVAHTTSPFVTIYSRSGTTLTKLSDPGTLPTGNGQGVSFTRDGLHLAVAHTTTPFVTIYSISGTTFTKLTNPATLPDGNATDVCFSSDNQFMAVSHATSQFMTLYRYVSSVWTKQTDPATLPDGVGESCSFSPNNRFLAIGHQTSQFITIYEAYNWLDMDATGTTSTLTTTSGGHLQLTGSLYNAAKRVQAISVLNADKNVEHFLDVTFAPGRALLRIGTTYGDDDLLEEIVIEAGSETTASHVLSFTPTTNLIFIEISATRQAASTFREIAIAASGTAEITTPFSVSNLQDIRYAQSGDVIFLACKDVAQYKIKRLGSRSWAFVLYHPEDGPFRALNTSLITLTPSGLTGQVSLTASRPFFKSEHINALMRLTSIGQNTSDSFTAANQFSAVEIKVTGTGTQRNLTIARSGTWSATITLQRSPSAPGSWTDVATFTTNGTATYNDDLDNQTIYYRIGIKTGDYTSGTAVVTMNYSSGGITGVGRVVAFTSETVATMDVISPLGATTATENWEEGAWSTYRSFPSALCLHEGRLWWAGMDKVYGSVSDDYESFDDATEGDSAPIERSIGEGPVDDINWLLPLQRMLVGTEGSELSAKSNSFDEPLTASNFTLKAASTHGSANIGPLKIDNTGIYVHRNGERVMQLAYDIDTYDYTTSDLTRLIPEICDGGVERIAVQRLPDTRVHVVKTDGTVALLVFDEVENVICWVDIETDGIVEDVAVLPSTPEDAVYYVVKRTINSATKRYLEKWAFEEDCQGGTKNKQADSFIEYTSISTATLTGLDHLEGETVVCWADGVYKGTFTVASGSITLPASVSNAIVGLTYTARYKSTKLAYAAGGGTALNQRKRVEKIGVVLYNTHHDGLRIGDSYSFLRDLPTMINNKAVVADTIHSEYDHDMNAYNTKWSTDSRVCLEATAPKPVTILALTFGLETNG